MDKFLSSVEEKVLAGEALSLDDGCRLFAHDDLLSIGAIAHKRRTALHGKTTYFNWNLHLNSTNVCEADCIFCSFARLKDGMPQAYTMDVKKARQWITERYDPRMTEIHIVNGLNPGLPFEYYEDLLRMIRAEFPNLHVKAFTAVEIHYFAEKFDMSYEEVFERLLAAGLQSMPGGGAEIFAERARKKLCRDKVDADGWLEVHRVAHNMGLRTNCTMLYGTIETEEEICDHLIHLRSLQEETGGFQVFIPLAFHNDGNRLKNLPSPTGWDDLRVIAISRLMLHNIPHIKAYWVMLSPKIAQVALRFGANDFDGTVTEEKIYHMAGSQSPNALTIDGIKRVIKRAGLEPVERNTIYQPVNRDEEIEEDERARAY